MQFETDPSNAGQSHFCLDGDGGAKLAVSVTALGCAQGARHAAADVRLHAGSADGTEERR